MDKRLIIAVAGSGKTRKIVEDLDTTKRTLIITYTIKNQEEIRNRVYKKFNTIPENIHIFGLFQFLFNFCIKPTAKFPKIKGFILSSDIHYGEYLSGDMFFSNMLSKWILDNYDEENIARRLEMFFDVLYVDEFQDLTSYDFDLMLKLGMCDVDTKTWFLGDFYQKTFNSSNNGNKSTRIHKDYNKWIKAIKDSGYLVDDESLTKSNRCSSAICNFIKTKLGIAIESSLNHEGMVKFVEDRNEIDELIKNNDVKKLFYQKHYDYNCNSSNWGESKGREFDKVCVVLNKTMCNIFNNGNFNSLKPDTRSRFYVACTRAKNELYFVRESDIKKYKN